MDLFIELNQLMRKYRFRPKRKLCQHFLIDERIIEKMIEESELKKQDTVLEIGAGTGFLTRELQKYCSVIAVEFDEKLCELLQNELKEENLQLICEDFLKAELPAFNKVVSTPPYHISKKIMLKLLKKGFDLGVLVFQEEFIEKLIALPGFPQYCALTVLTQYKMFPQVVAKVDASSFFPKPKARSKMVKLIKNEGTKKAANEKLFFRFVEELFRYKNKNMSNALLCAESFLKQNLKLSGKDSLRILKEFDLEKKVVLTEVEEFIEMFNKLYEEGYAKR